MFRQPGDMPLSSAEMIKALPNHPTCNLLVSIGDAMISEHVGGMHVPTDLDDDPLPAPSVVHVESIDDAEMVMPAVPRDHPFRSVSTKEMWGARSATGKSDWQEVLANSVECNAHVLANVERMIVRRGVEDAVASECVAECEKRLVQSYVQYQKVLEEDRREFADHLAQIVAGMARRRSRGLDVAPMKKKRRGGRVSAKKREAEMVRTQHRMQRIEKVASKMRSFHLPSASIQEFDKLVATWRGKWLEGDSSDEE